MPLVPGSASRPWLIGSAAALIAALLVGGGKLAAQQPAAPQERVVRQLDFDGNHAISDEILASVIATTNSSGFATSPLVRWIGLGEKRYFDSREFQADVLRLQVFYIRSGYPDVTIDTVVRREPRDIYLTFKINEGLPVRVDTLSVLGLDSFPQQIQKKILTDLPLRVGDVFNRFLMQADADTIVRRLKDHGYPSADVFTSFESRQADRTATIVLAVVPGAEAWIGALHVAGENRVDSATVTEFITARPGDRFSQSDLYQSQRNLYQSDLFRFAAVNIDTTGYRPGSDTVPLLIQVNEAKPHRVRGGLGYGTTDCFRGSAGWTVRNFFGNGRIFDLSGRLSKVGVGTPLDWGLDRGICRTVRDDSIGSRKLNYNVTASLRRPAFLSPQNTVTLSAFVERRSEFKVYQREDVGGSIALTHETVGRRLPLSLTYSLSYGRTQATEASFCAFLQVCDQASIDFLQQRRRLATLTFLGTMPAVNSPVDPTRGHLASLETTWASRYIGSAREEQFTRILGDIAWYRPLNRSVVLSWRLRGGIIFAPTLTEGGVHTAFVPPEQRFYAGGPNDVRGYQRNELGPVVYVTTRSYYDSVTATGGAFSPDSVQVAATGGNTMVVGNVELRIPSPILPSRARLAFFVDAGALWQRGQTSLSTRLIRVTPGFGVRVATPLGPLRLDIAYNPYKLQPGPLFVSDSSGGLTQTRNSFVLSRNRKVTIHFAVGQAF